MSVCVYIEGEIVGTLGMEKKKKRVLQEGKEEEE